MYCWVSRMHHNGLLDSVLEILGHYLMYRLGLTGEVQVLLAEQAGRVWLGFPSISGSRAKEAEPFDHPAAEPGSPCSSGLGLLL